MSIWQVFYIQAETLRNIAEQNRKNLMLEYYLTYADNFCMFLNILTYYNFQFYFYLAIRKINNKLTVRCGPKT